MNWEAIDALSSFVATVATLITLIYLAIQIRDSNRLVRTESLQNVLNGYTDRVLNPIINDAQMSELVDRGMASWEALTVSERGRFTNHQVREVLQVQNIMQLYESGLLSEVDFNAWLYHVATTLITPGGKVAWNYNRATITPTVVGLLEHFIEKHPDLMPYTEIHPYRFEGKSLAS